MTRFLKSIRLKTALQPSCILTGLGGEHAEAVVPEAGGDEEARVDGGHEAVAARAHPLREVVAELPSRQCTRAASRCELNHS